MMQVGTEIFLCQCHYSVIFYTWKLNQHQMQVPVGLKGGIYFLPDFHRSVIVSPKLQNVCQKNNMWEYHHCCCEGSNMLFRVGQQYRVGRKTRLIAVLTEIHKRGRSYQP